MDSLLLPERIRLRQDSLSPGHRRVARFCLSQPQAASELAAARIGQMVGVSESTVVRLALRLGYEGFPDLQEALRETLRARTSSASLAERHSADSGTLTAMLRSDTRNLAETIADLSHDELVRAVDLLSAANSIFVVGFRTSFSLAYLASFLMKQVHPQTRLLDDSGGTLPDDLVGLAEGDVLLAISFPRYVRKTVQAVDYAVAHNVRTIAITDSFLSPISIADVVLSVRHDTPSFFNSNIAATAVVNALVAELAERMGRVSPEYQRRLVETFYEWAQPERTTRSLPPTGD